MTSVIQHLDCYHIYNTPPPPIRDTDNRLLELGGYHDPDLSYVERMESMVRELIDATSI